MDFSKRRHHHHGAICVVSVKTLDTSGAIKKMNCYKISCPLKSLETPLVTAEAQGK